MIRQLFVALVVVCAIPVQAVIDGYQFDDEVTRQRYLAFIEEMRCPKCQNQNLAGSDSPIAADLRRELYRMLQDGKADKEIVDFMVARYGDYVLYRPQVNSSTWLLWGLPGGLLAVGLLVVMLTVKRRAINRQPELEVSSVSDEERIKQLRAAAKERLNKQ
ncbi:MAG: cytochrome c-type biogenesis protein [Cellvibrionaceae bacterium]